MGDAKGKQHLKALVTSCERVLPLLPHTTLTKRCLKREAYADEELKVRKSWLMGKKPNQNKQTNKKSKQTKKNPTKVRQLGPKK